MVIAASVGAAGVADHEETAGSIGGEKAVIGIRKAGRERVGSIPSSAAIGREGRGVGLSAAGLDVVVAVHLLRPRRAEIVCGARLTPTRLLFRRRGRLGVGVMMMRVVLLVVSGRLEVC